MPIFEFDGRRPDVHPSAWVAPTATLVGNVRIEKDASIWYGAVLRGDVGPIVVGEGSNVQDNSVLHVKSGLRLDIGPFSTVAHGCVVHGLSIGSRSLIGNGATLSDGSVVGSRAMVAAGSLVTPGFEVPDGCLAMGVPARVAGPIEEGSNAAQILARNAQGYVELMRLHRDRLSQVD